MTDKASLTVGATSTGELGVDPLDDPHPPTLPGRYIDLVTRHAQADLGWSGQSLPAMRYRAEYGPPLGFSARMLDLSLETDQTGAVTVTWTITPDADLAAHLLTLRDVTTGATVDMWAVSAYSFAATPGSRPLRIEASPGRVPPPLAFDQAPTLAEDTSLPITLSAADAQNRPLTYRTLTPPSHGTLLGSEPNLTYFPAANYNGPDAFTFVANNGSADSNVATVAITVTPVNDPPVAVGQAVSTDEDTAVAIRLLGTDVDGDALTFNVGAGPNHGTLSGTGADLVYIPAADYSGVDAFSFTANDGQLTSVPAAVSIAVVAVPDSPRAAFSVPGPARDAATLDNNLTSYFEGASIASASSESAGFPASYAIDEGAQTLWRSANGQPTNQFLTVRLAEGSSIDRIRLVNGYGAGGQAVKRFEVRVSITTADPAAFRTVSSEIALDAANVQEFALPATTPARYVQLFVLDNWGNPCCVAVREFEAVSDARGGIPTYSRTPSNVALASEGASLTATSEFSGFPGALAIDGSPGTRWVSGSGRTANESLTVTLARGKSYKVDRVRIWNAFGAAAQAVRDFRIAVSNTTTDTSAFAATLSGTLQDVAAVQEFVFPGGPIDARQVRFTALNNYGSACCSSIADLEVVPLPSKPPSVSSYLSPDFRPELILDGKSSTAWRPASGRVANEFVEVRLEDDVLVDRVGLLGWPSAADWTIKDFEIQLSTTSDDDAAFTPVLSATNLNTGTPQEFAFPGGPRRARYVRLLAKNNYGNAVVLTVSSFEVVTVASEGNRISTNATVLGSSSQFGSFGPQAALDADPAPPGWVTASGQTNNQWLKIALPASHAWLLDHVALQPRSEPGFETSSPRRFEIQLSTTTGDDNSFATALKETLRNNGTLQHFFFDAVDAKYVRVLLEDSYGGSVSGLQTFAVYSPQIGSLNARFRDRSTDVDGAIDAYAWTFGDGGSSSERDPAHAYATAGRYDVTLAATDDSSLTGSRTQPYDAVGGPQPSFSLSPSAPGEGAAVTFTDSSVDPVGVVLREWDFGDGKPRIVTAGPTATHAYDDDGAYPVTLRVTNSWGTAASVSQDLAVANLPPTADAGSDRRVRLGQDWGASPLVGDPGAADLSSLRCQWSFGDGQTADIQSCSAASVRVAHTYATQGIYPATLTVTDKDGASRSDTIMVRVYPPECMLGAAGFVEFPFCGSGYSVATLGTVPGLQASSYSGLIVDRDDANQLLLGTNAIDAQGAIYTVGLVRDAGHHISGFSGTPALMASVPYVDGGLAYGPNGVLFTAQFPIQTLVQIKPGSHALDKVTPNASIGVNSISLNFTPHGFPGECALKFVSFFTAQWWSSTIAPNASGTYDVSPAYEAARINNGGPEHLLYVPAGSAIFADRNTVLVTEYSASNIVAYNLDAKGDPIPSTRAVFMSGYPAPEAMAIDPVTGDLLVSNLGGVSVNRIAGLRPPASQVALAPATATLELGRSHTLVATVMEPLGAGRAGVSVAFAVTSGPNAGATGSCAPNPDCTTDANGVVRFTYTGSSTPGTDSVQASFVGASCGTVASPLVSVAWTTSRPPVAQVAAVTTDEDSSVEVVLVASDPDGHALTYQVTVTPQHGVLSGTAPNLVYTPAANYNGPETFAFKANDGVADSNEAVVSITVNAVNDAPVASLATAATAEDGSTLITLPVSDVDGDALTYLIVTPPAHGTLSGTGGSRSYAPASNYNGPDGFTFKANDATLDSNVATVSVTVTPVNDAPVASDQSVATSEDTPLAITLVATDVDGDSLTYAIVSPPAHGVVSGTGASRTYTPAANYNGPDSFTFKANDGAADSNEAAVSITVNAVNDAPVAADQAVTTDEDTPVAVTLLAADLDGGALSYVLGTPPAHGSLTGMAPVLSYIPAANEHGLDSFSFSVNDGSAISNLATVSISVTPVNDAPAAPNVSLQVVQGQPSPVSIAATDVDGDAITYTIVSLPAHGMLGGSVPDLIYTSAANYAGPDAFMFKASDGAAESNLATVFVDVVGQLNHAPVCTGALADQASLWPPNHKLRPIAVSHVSDEDGDPVAIQATAIWSDEPADAPGSGNKSPDAVLEPIQVRSERSGDGNGRVYVVEFTAADGHGASCAGVVQVCVPHDPGQGNQCIDDGVRYDATKK